MKNISGIRKKHGYASVNIIIPVLLIFATIISCSVQAAVGPSLKATTVKPGRSGYILPNSDIEYLEEEDLKDLTAAELRVARNEIYARRGRKFKDKDLQEYFNARSWYNGRFSPDKFDEAGLLNVYEKANVSLIKQCENAKTQELELSEYIFANSDSRYLKEADLEGLSARSLRIARNEIYARRGRLFKDKDLQAYFDSCSWYDGRIKPEKFDSQVFNKYESKNISFIRKWENSLGKKASSKDYILPDSDKEYLTFDDVCNLSTKTIWLAKNEIYARHGRLFKNEELQTYFNNCSWYKGKIKPAKFDAAEILNKYEKANVAFLKSWEGDSETEDTSSPDDMYYDPEEIRDMVWAYYVDLYEDGEAPDTLEMDEFSYDEKYVYVSLCYSSGEDDWTEANYYSVNRYTGIGKGKWDEIIDFNPWA